MIKTSTIALVAAFFFGLFSSVVGQTAQTQVNPDEEEIRKFILRGIERFNKHEVQPTGVAAFTPDADFVNVEGMWMRGAQEINRVHTKASTTWLKDAKITLIELTVRFVRPDVVIVRQLHEMTGSQSPSGENLPPHKQLSIRVLVKENGKWMTTAFQNTKVDSQVASVTTPKK